MAQDTGKRRGAGEKAPARCSFCDKSQDEVEFMIGGPRGVFICTDCVDLCADIIRTNRTYGPKRPRLPASGAPGTTG